MTTPLLLRSLLAPESVLSLDLAEWDLLIRQGRRANLLSRLALVLEQRLDAIPLAPRRHITGALLIARRQAHMTRWEVLCIRDALAPLGIEPVLLKGAAYLIADLPASHGRLFGDVDILVPKARIGDVETALLAQGWSFSPDLTAYDQRYYREWMHEIPPLGHHQRGTSLDVHHTILPPTARIKVNTEALFEDTRTVAELTGVRILAPAAMFLHSAAHLFHEGELNNGLRDLFDLDALLRDFGHDPSFWTELVPRARALGLTRPLFYALRYTSQLLDTPMPSEVRRQAAADAPRGQAWLDACYNRALMPMHESCDRTFTGSARLAIYLRSHWLRMPMHLLGVHLARKSWLRMQPEAELRT